MRINTVDSTKNEVNITLNSSELVAICNALYRDKELLSQYNEMYSDFMMIRELSQYGYVDNWVLTQMIKQRGLKENKETSYF